MSKINKVLYNVDQRDRSTGEINTSEEMWMARHNIGLDEVIGWPTVIVGGKEYTGIAPLGKNGLVPAEYLPSYVDEVIDGYAVSVSGVIKFYEDPAHTQEIAGEEGYTYVDITDPDAGIGYRWTEASGFFQISSQSAFGRISVDDSYVTADRPMDTLKVVGDSWIGVSIEDIDHVDTLTITHNKYVGSGYIGETEDTEGRNEFQIPWAEYDDQGHIVNTGMRTHELLLATTSADGITRLTSGYGTDETMAVTQKGVQNAIGQLDYGNKLSAGKFISALSQTDGKIDYTVSNMDTTPTANSSNPVTSGGVKAAINALDATKTYNGTNFSVTVTEADGVITGVTGTDNTANKTHDHGSISSAGKVTVAATTKKALLITDNDNFVKTGPAFGTESGDANLFLNKNGNWTNVSTIGDTAVCYVDSTSHGLKTIYITSSTDSSYVHASGLSTSYVGNGGNYIFVNTGTGLYVDSDTSSSDFGKLSLKMQTDRTAVGNGSLAWSHSVGCFWFCSPQIRVGSSAGAYITGNQTTTNNNTYLLFNPGFSEGLITGVQFIGSNGITVTAGAASGDTNLAKMTITMPNTFQITEGSYSSKPEGIQMSLACSDTSSGASVGIYKANGSAIAWPSSSTATKLGYLAPAFASGTTGKMLVVDNGKVVWDDISASDTVIKYSGSPSLSDDAYNTMADAIGSDNLATIMYGVGSGSSYWHLLKVDTSGYTFDYITSDGQWRNMVVGRDKTVSMSTKGYLAPVINPSDNGKVLAASHDGTYASTRWERNFAVPTFGKYDLATSSGGSMYINTDILPSSYVSSYLCSYTSSMSTTDTKGTSILCVPPHHRGSAHCIVYGSSPGGDASQGSTSWIRFYLTDTQDPTTEPGNFGASALWHGNGMWTGSYSMDFKHASFIYRNDGDQSKYITCFIGSSSPPASFTIYKEFEMFPTE